LQPAPAEVEEAKAIVLESEGYEQYMEDALLAENHQWGEDWEAFIEEWNADVLPVLEEMGS
jgi:tripartite-type tricarboxylate transporter receptor subunit TctC